MFTVTADESGDYYLGNGHGNFQRINPEKYLSRNGNGNFQKNNSRIAFFSLSDPLITMVLPSLPFFFLHSIFLPRDGGKMPQTRCKGQMVLQK